MPVQVLEGGCIEVITHVDMPMMMSVRHFVNLRPVDENTCVISDVSEVGEKGIVVKHSYDEIKQAIIKASQKIAFKVLI